MNPMKLLKDYEPLETAAIANFLQNNPTTQFDIVVIIPSYLEEESIEGVLKEIPKEIENRQISVLVVVDGPDDGASIKAHRHGAYTCSTGGHCGQGAALRLGYRIAIAHGASFVVSIDADGQYLPAQIPRVLAPLLRSEADFVTGSRRLGEDGTQNRFRSIGVNFFAALISKLTNQQVTDPTFGLRAMSAEVVRRVTLRQPQYQALELLIGVLIRGFRVVECPGTIRLRTAGTTRKGGDILYGLRVFRVVVSTIWREWRSA